MSVAKVQASTSGADPFAAGGPSGEVSLASRAAGFQIAGEASSSPLAGDAAGVASGKPDAVQPPPAPRPETVSIHITTDAAALLAVLAADQGESPGSMVARLVAEDIERKGGIAHV